MQVFTTWVITRLIRHFHGANGAGLGTNHQNGWTNLMAKLIDIFNNRQRQNTHL